MRIRVLSVGLLVSSYLTLHLGIHFFRHMIMSSPIVSFTQALDKISPTSVQALGLHSIVPIAYTLACVGTGVGIASVVYPTIETVLVRYFRAHFHLAPSRNMAKFVAKEHV